MHPEGLIFVVTGDRGSGKSTVCARVAREAAEQGLTVAGILTEREDQDPGSPRRVVDLRSGEARPFGVQDRERAQDDCRDPADAIADPLTPGWEFGSGVFAWANRVLNCSIPCDVLVVDEVGPLELLGGRGWSKALDMLGSAGYRAALVVCRLGLLKQLQERLCGGSCTVVEVTPETRDGLPAEILAHLLTANRPGPAGPN